MIALTILNLLRENQSLRHQLATDALTGIGSRRAYQERLSQPGSKSFIVIDVDNFKRINDTYGHEAGDAILKAIARLIRTETDFCYRPGGDEFVAVLECDCVAAQCVADRIQAAISSVSIHGVLCSVSAGVGPTYSSADAAMYSQKHQK